MNSILTVELINRLYEANFKLSTENLFKLRDISNIIHDINHHSSETAQHCINVSMYSVKIGRSMGLTENELIELWYASILHDVGKLNIPSAILGKNSGLTQREYEFVKSHSYLGYQMMRSLAGFESIAEFILQHHERYDGEGYPCKRKANEINLISRIITVADAYDAMVSTRSYKNPKTSFEAMKELKKEKQKQFDSSIVDCFIELLNKNYFKEACYV